MVGLPLGSRADRGVPDMHRAWDTRAVCQEGGGWWSAAGPPMCNKRNNCTYRAQPPHGTVAKHPWLEQRETRL
jgi:hypothetical protein